MTWTCSWWWMARANSDCHDDTCQIFWGSNKIHKVSNKITSDRRWLIPLRCSDDSYKADAFMLLPRHVWYHHWDWNFSYTAFKYDKQLIQHLPNQVHQPWFKNTNISVLHISTAWQHNINREWQRFWRRHMDKKHIQCSLTIKEIMTFAQCVSVSQVSYTKIFSGRLITQLHLFAQCMLGPTVFICIMFVGANCAMCTMYEGQLCLFA